MLLVQFKALARATVFEELVVLEVVLGSSFPVVLRRASNADHVGCSTGLMMT